MNSLWYTHTYKGTQHLNFAVIPYFIWVFKTENVTLFNPNPCLNKYHKPFFNLNVFRGWSLKNAHSSLVVHLPVLYFVRSPGVPPGADAGPSGEHLQSHHEEVLSQEPPASAYHQVGLSLPTTTRACRGPCGTDLQPNAWRLAPQKHTHMHSCTHTLMHSLTHSLTHSFTQALTHSHSSLSVGISVVIQLHIHSQRYTHGHVKRTSLPYAALRKRILISRGEPSERASFNFFISMFIWQFDNPHLTKMFLRK